MPQETPSYISIIREEYPQYEDIDDLDLAKAYHQKHYSDFEEDAFLDKIGMHQNSMLEDAVESVGEIPVDAISDGISAGIQRTTDAFTSMFDDVPQEEAQPKLGDEAGAVTDPALHNAVAPNTDGTIPVQEPIIKKEETTLLDDTKAILFGNGKGYENPETTEYELGKRLVNRTNELTSNAIQATYNLLGNIKSPIEYLGFEPEFMKENNKARKEWYKEASDKLNSFVYEANKMDVKPTHTWEETKKGFENGGVFDIDAWQELGNYIVGEGIVSLPDMAEMVAMMPIYYASRQQESAEKRAKNEGRNEPTLEDYKATAPTVMGSVILDKFSLDGMTKDVVERIGKEAIDGSMKTTMKVVGSEMKKGAIKEAVTEGMQNPLEKFGEEVGTKKGLSSAETYADEALAGAVAGGGMGAGMSGVTATGAELYKTYDTTKKEKAKQDYIAEILRPVDKAPDDYEGQYNKDDYTRPTPNAEATDINEDGVIIFTEIAHKADEIQEEFTNLIINNPDLPIPVEAPQSIILQEQILKDAKEAGLDVSSDGGLNAIDKGFKDLEAEIGGDALTPLASEEPIIPVEEPIIENPVVGEPEPEAKETDFELRNRMLQQYTDNTNQEHELDFGGGLKVRAKVIDILDDGYVKVLTHQGLLENIKAERLKPIAENTDFAKVPKQVETQSVNVDTARLKELQEMPEEELTTDEKFELEDLELEAQELGSDETTSKEKANTYNGEFVDDWLSGLSDKVLLSKYENTSNKKTKNTFEQEIEKRNLNSDIINKEEKQDERAKQTDVDGDGVSKPTEPQTELSSTADGKKSEQSTSPVPDTTSGTSDADGEPRTSDANLDTPTTANNASERGSQGDDTRTVSDQERGSGDSRGEPTTNTRADGELGDNRRGREPKLKDDTEQNFEIEEELGEGGAKTKFKNNIKAIELVKKIHTTNYKPTPQEKATLSKYVGWGGLPNAFVRPDGTIAKGWEKEAKELQDLLTTPQYEEARRSTQDAHYTSKEIINAIWSGVKHLGFKGGKVLEPSVGVGSFFGFMPSGYKVNTKLYGVELDGITSTIAQTLYPKANIQNKGFQEVELSNDFSLVIGNPPFGSQKLFDKNSKHLKDMSIHNYFFAKGMDALEEGGIMAMVVSNGLLDAGNTKTREYLGESANLIGAIRLPNNAFSKNANTEVTTDIIFLQKRYKDQSSNIDEWKDIGEINDTPLNNYFVNNEAMMLGKWGKYGSMYRGDSPALVAFEGNANTAGMLLPDAINSLAKNIVTHDSVLKEDTSVSTFDGDTSKVRVGAMFVQDGTIYKRNQDKDGEVQVERVETKLNAKGDEVFYKDNELAKIKGMVEVVSVADELRVLQLDKDATPAKLKRARAELNKSYDAFVKKYKYLNSTTNARLFEDDIRSPFLLALETGYDKGVSAAIAKRTGEIVKKEVAYKADIFTTRTQTPYERPTSADTAQDALTISLGEYGNINLIYMEDLTGKSEDELVQELDGFIFDDIHDGWVTKEEFLSGNVKKKLAETTNPHYKAVLQEVIPKDIEALDISVTLGSSWIPKTDMEDFVAHITGDDNPSVSLIQFNAKWNVSAQTTSAKATQWGTPRRKADDILKQTMNLVQMEVKDNHGTSYQPQMVVNVDETTAVQEKQTLLKAEFKEWIWKSSDRRERLAKIYNETFNTKTLREFDGSHIQFVGKSDSIDLRQHQKDGTWRVLQGGTTLFDHTVGTGKTFTAIASVMELRRTGKANKPLIVVPNHLTAQWGKEWMELYPSASILVPSKKDFSAKRRKLLMSRMATGDYDGIIIAHSQLTKIQNDVEFEKAFIEKEIQRVQEAIDMLKAEDGKSRSVKDAEKSKERLQEKIDKLNDMDRDDNLDFSQLGIDAVVVDEAHEFKNLTYTTGLQKVAGLGNPQGSKKAFDLFIKTQNLLEKTNGNNLVFLTGTPISNTIAEMFTMQRYLAYDKLQEDNLDVFDAWVKQYAEIVSDWELSPSGKYKLNTRLSKFNNMPELITEYKQFADVVTREDIPALPIPKIKGGRPQNIVVDRSETQADYIGIEDENGRYPESSLVYRSENLPKGKPKKGDDNMLKIMGEARKVALDMRLIDPNAEDNPNSKVNLTVKNAFDIYQKWNAKKGAQLIFCDLSTPKGAVANEKAKIEALIKKADAGDEKASEELDRMNPDDLDALNSSFSVYDDIKAKLLAKGIPANEVVFIHDAKTDLQKQELFAKVKSGKVRVLLGSTSKMGAGMNVQDRLVALHHIDVPWRPSDLEQREGRIIRQGNIFFKEDPKGFEVEIFRYATKNTLDYMMWQTIEAKANFIEQLRAGNLLEREVEDVSGEAMSAGEMKAMSSGNPLILEDMKLKKDIKKLEALKKSHDRSQYDLEAKIKGAQARVDEAPQKIKSYEADARLSKKLPKDFKMTLDGVEFDSREDAGSKLINIITKLKPQESKLVGDMGGFKIYLENVGKGLSLNTTGIITLSNELDYEFTINIEEQKYGGLSLKIGNTIKRIPEDARLYEENSKYQEEQLPELQEQVAGFKSVDELDAKRARQKEIMTQLRQTEEDKNKAREAESEVQGDEIESYMKAPVDKDFGVNYPEFKGKPVKAIEHLLKVKNGQVIGAMHKKDIGDIDFVWGKAEVKKGKIKGFGLAKIKEKHGETLVKKIPQLIRDGEITKQTKKHIEITTTTHEAVIYLDWFNTDKVWLMTAYEVNEPSLQIFTDVGSKNEESDNLSSQAYSKSITKAQEKSQDDTNSYAQANGYDEAGRNYIPTYSFSGVPTRPVDGKITIGNRVVQLPTLDKPINTDSLRVYVTAITGNRLYEEKLKNKSALGVYKHNDSAIRLKNYSDIEVLAHEMAHYLDFFHNNKTKDAKGSYFRKEILKNKDEVKALSYTVKPKQVIKEGFAEFVRLWLSNYNALNLVAPNMVKDFEAKMKKDKKLYADMVQLQDGIHQYYFQGEHASLRSKRGGELNSIAKKIQRSQAEIAKDTRQKIIDKIHTIKRIEAEVTGDIAPDAINSPYKALQLVNGHSSIMYSTMNFGAPSVLENGDISYNGKPLNDIFAPATSVSVARVRLLEDYLVARRASELMEQGRENLITQEEIDTGLSLGETYPEFETIFDDYQVFNDAMLDFYVDMKHITKQQRANFKEMNKDYVPFHRITESVQFGTVPPSKIGQRLTGGTHSLGNIMENIINGVESNIKEALISRGKSMFYEMLETSGMGGVYATKVSTESKLVKDDLDAQASKVATIMAMMGITITKDGMVISGKSDAENFYDVDEIKTNLMLNPKTLDVWTHGHTPTSVGGYIDSVIIDDKKVFFETHDAGLVDAMTSFSGTHHNEAVQLLMGAKNIMTWNITNNPLFYLTNFARDTVSAGVLSKNSFKPVYTSIVGMYHFITKSKVFKAYMASGAGYGTRRTALGSDIESLKMLNVNRGLDVWARLISAMEYGADVFEYGTRVGEFALAQEKGKSNLQSSFEGREISTDFAIGGSNKVIAGFMATVPFMKAGLLGIDKTARRIFTLNGEMKFSNSTKFKNQRGELQAHKLKIYLMGGMIAGATLALWMQNRDDERYKKLTRDSKLMYWHLFIGDKHYKIPRPYDIGFAFASVPEIVADGIYTKEGKDAAKDFVWGVKNMFSIGDVSGLFQPILDDVTNTNWTGSPIVPSNMQNLDDMSDQYFSTTPLLYKEAGDVTGLSPIKMQHYTAGYLGLTAKMVEEATENMLWNSKEWGARPFAKDPLEFMTYRFKARDVEPRTKYSEKYYELMQKANGVKASYEKKKKEAVIDKGADIREYMSDKEKGAYVSISKALKKYNKTLTAVKNSVEMTKYDKTKTKAQKEKIINDAYLNKTELFKNTVESVETALEKFEGK